MVLFLISNSSLSSFDSSEHLPNEMEIFFFDESYESFF